MYASYAVISASLALYARANFVTSSNFSVAVLLLLAISVRLPFHASSLVDIAVCVGAVVATGGFVDFPQQREM